MEIDAVAAARVDGRLLDVALAELDTGEAVLVREAARLGELRVGHVDPDHPAVAARGTCGEEAVGARAAAEVEHRLAGADGREVEEVADAGEGVDRGRRDAVELVGWVAEPLGQRAAGLEVELALGLECDLLVHRLDALLELGRVEPGCRCRGAHAAVSSVMRALRSSCHSGQPSVEAARAAAAGAQAPHRLVGIRAERAAAVGHDLGVGRQLGEPALELVERDRARALDVAGLVLDLGAHVDEHDVAAREPLEQVLAADRVDVLAEVLAGGALDLGQARGRRVAQREPQPQRLVARERVAHARALARASDHARGAQRLQVLRGVRLRLPARAAPAPRRCAAPARAGRAAPAARGLANALPISAIASNSASFVSPGAHRLLFNRSLDSLSSRSDSHDTRSGVFFRQLLNDDTACASYLLGCTTHGRFAVVDPHVDLVDDYVALAEAQGVADRRGARDARAGRPRLRACRRSSSAPARPPTCRRAPASTSTITRSPTATSSASATPRSRRSRRPATRSPTTPTWSPTTRRADEPWLVLTGDALLVGDAGRPDLHAHGEHSVEEMARTLYRSLTERLLTLPDHLVLYPAHYSGSVCGRGLSATPLSTIGFERRHNPALRFGSEDAFVEALRARHPARAPSGRPRSSPPTAPAARSSPSA